MITETDLAIIHALQVNPRAPWRTVGGVLGLSGETVARRWDVLHSAGHAWIAPVPGPGFLAAGWSAFVYLRTAPSEQPSVVEQLCKDASFGTVSRTTGPYDLFADCFAATHSELMEQLTGPFADIPGLMGREVLLVTKIYRQASEWRSDALAQGQASAQSPQDGGTADGTGFFPDALDAELVRALAHDGRAGWADLAGRCDVSPQTARRRVERLLASGHLSLRCDTAPDVHPGHHEVTLLFEIPPDRLDAVGRHCASMPSCRVSAQVLGSGNLLVTLWIRDYLDVQRLEAELVRAAPGTRAVSRHAVLRTDKRMGRLLAADGRAAGVVPLPLWSRAAAGAGRPASVAGGTGPARDTESGSPPGFG